MADKASRKTPVLRLENVCKVYDGATPFTALEGITLDIYRGEFVAIVGPSGSGKSTMLHMLGCLDRPTSGEIYVDGAPISKMKDDQVADIRAQNIGFVFQAFNLASTLSVYKNVELPLMIQNIPKGQRDAIIRRNLSEVHLLDKLKSLPSQLSGGQKQRVAIARALSNSPKILMADEPTGNLDSISSSEIMEYIIDLCKNSCITLILVTHDLKLASRADRLVRIMDGTIESDSPKETDARCR
jgi:putative ABC transport system ATP-binding protein